MPKESDKASAIDTVKTPPRKTIFQWVPEFNPTINPSVVIILEVNPKLNPVFIECLTILLSISFTNLCWIEEDLKLPPFAFF